MNAQRQLFTHWAVDQLGKPVLWGAKGTVMLLPTGLYVDVFDCSGLVTCGYLHVKAVDWVSSANTDKLWAWLPEVLMPEPGDLAFYGGTGPEDVEHVAIVLAGGHVVCASGASSRITTLRAAREHNARVQVFSTHLYRKDFRGFRRSTPLDEMRLTDV